MKKDYMCFFMRRLKFVKKVISELDEKTGLHGSFLDIDADWDDKMSELAYFSYKPYRKAELLGILREEETFESIRGKIEAITTHIEVPVGFKFSLKALLLPDNELIEVIKHEFAHYMIADTTLRDFTPAPEDVHGLEFAETLTSIGGSHINASVNDNESCNKDFYNRARYLKRNIDWKYVIHVIYRYVDNGKYYDFFVPIKRKYNCKMIKKMDEIIFDCFVFEDEDILQWFSGQKYEYIDEFSVNHFVYVFNRIEKY